MNDMIIFKIKDRKYGMRKMPPIRGAAFGLRVSSAISKMLASKNAMDALTDIQKRFKGLVSPEEGKKEDAVTEVTAEQAVTFGQTIVQLLSEMDPDAVTDIFREAFSYEVYYETLKLSDDVQFDEHFSQYPGDLYPVAIWATYNHVKDFFTGLGDGIKAFMPNSGTSLNAHQ